MRFGKSRCHGCGAEIEWLKLPDGGFMPCNPGRIYCVPDRNGDTYGADATGQVQRVRTVGAGTSDCWLMRVPHRVTCTALREQPRYDRYEEPRRRAAPPPRKPEQMPEPAPEYAQISLW